MNMIDEGKVAVNKLQVTAQVKDKQHKVWSHLVAFGVGVVCGMLLMVLVY